MRWLPRSFELNRELEIKSVNVNDADIQPAIASDAQDCCAF